MKLKLLRKYNIFGLVEQICKYNQVTVIRQQFFHKCDRNKQKSRYELMPSAKCQPCERFVRNDLAKRKTRSHRLASEKFL